MHNILDNILFFLFLFVIMTVFFITVENKSYNKYPGGNVDTGEFNNSIFIRNNLWYFRVWSLVNKFWSITDKYNMQTKHTYWHSTRFLVIKLSHLMKWSFCILCNKHAKWDLYSAIALKQQSADRHVALLGHIIMLADKLCITRYFCRYY